MRVWLQRWPGVLLLLVLLGGAVALITRSAITTHDASTARAKLYERSAKTKRSIKDGKSNRDDITSDDGQVGNPKTYTSAGMWKKWDERANMREGRDREVCSHTVYCV